MLEVYIATIVAFPYGYAPLGWALCDGTELQIRQYTALYSLINTLYGGNGQTTFKLPNLIGAAPDPEMQYYIAMEGLYPVRA